MASIGKIARRTFLFGAVAVAGGAAFGTWYVTKPAPNPLKPGRDAATLNPFVLIDGEGVTLIAPRAEMGQGVQSTWAALLAEELDLDWTDVRVIHGPPARAYFNSALMSEALNTKGYDDSSFQHAMASAMGQLGKVFSLQVTGGSTAMRDGYEHMRVPVSGSLFVWEPGKVIRQEVITRDGITSPAMLFFSLRDGVRTHCATPPRPAATPDWHKHAV